MLAELINVIKFLLFGIPLPSSADNHQLKNAIYYEKKRLWLFNRRKRFKKKLFKLIKKIYEDKSIIRDQMIIKQKNILTNLVYENIDKQINKIIK